MFLNHIRFAIRNLKNQRMHTLVILLGLSVSMASAFLIYSYVYFERSYDDFHQDKNNLYRVVVDAQEVGKNTYKSPYSFSGQGPTALDEVPEVKSFTRLIPLSSMVISRAGESDDFEIFTIDDYYYADENFFKTFSFPLIQGNAENVLTKSGSMVITETLAQKLFGKENPIGKILLIDGKYTNKVTGVMEDIPENTHLKFDIIFPMKNIPQLLQTKNEWSNHSFFTYLILKDGADPNIAEAKITQAYLKENRAVDQSNCVWKLQPVNETYLNTGDFTSKPGAFKFGDLRMIYFLSVMVILILSVAWVNYINLTTAKNSERFNEIEIRKVNGAGKSHLLVQFFTESVLLNLTSLLLALLLVVLAFQGFAKFMAFPVNVLAHKPFWIIPAVVVLLSVLLSGFYTAFLLSQTSNIREQKPLSKYHLRNIMVALQFTIIIGLVSSVFVINRQLKHINKMNLGFHKDQVLVLNMPRISNQNITVNNIETLRTELDKYPGIVDVSAATSIPGKRFGNGNGSPKVSVQPSDDNYFRVGRVMKNYPELMDFKFIAGKSFDDSDNKMVINEAAVEEFGFNNPDEILNKKVNWIGNEFTVAGVTENFHQESLHILPEPMIMYTKQVDNDFNYIVVRLTQNDIKSTMENIEDEFKAEFPGNPFSFFFLDRYFNQQYQKDIRFRLLFSFFSIIALIIGYLGLYGLTTFTITKRIKEIGIRKVNGAKISEILTLLNKDFVKWVVIAFVIATPIAYFAMNKWLENFAYKTSLSWWIFALAGLLALGIALLTVSWQSWRAATRNPVEALRYE